MSNDIVDEASVPCVASVVDVPYDVTKEHVISIHDSSPRLPPPSDIPRDILITSGDNAGDSWRPVASTSGFRGDFASPVSPESPER